MKKKLLIAVIFFLAMFAVTVSVKNEISADYCDVDYPELGLPEGCTP